MRFVSKLHGASGANSNKPKREWVVSGGLSAIVLLVAAFASAQRIPKKELQFFTQPYTPPAKTGIRRHVFVVRINAVVRNAEGKAVEGLKKPDFEVFDNGKKQTITQFEAERAAPGIVRRQSGSSTRIPKTNSSPSPKATANKPAPRYVALFFDDRRTPFRYLKYAQAAAEKFVREDLHPGDEVGVFTASRTVTQDFTSNRQKLLTAIGSIRMEKAVVPKFLCLTVHYQMSPYTAYLILDRSDSQVLNLFNSCNRNHSPAQIQGEARTILYAAENISEFTLDRLVSVIGQLHRMPGQRVVVLISSGFFTASLARGLDAVAGTALDAGVVIDSLDAKGLVAPEGGGNENRFPYGPPSTPFERMIEEQRLAAENDVLLNLAMDTGGTYFHNRNDLSNGLGEMAAVPEVSYLIGFTPSKLKDNGGYHHLKVKVTAPGSFKIQSRPGYYAPPRPSKKKKKGPKDKVDPEVLKTNTFSGFPVGVKAQAGRLSSGKTGMLVSLHIDPRDLKFRNHKGRHLDHLSLVVALFGPDGKFVSGERGLVNMALKNKSLESLMQQGINASVVLQAPLGHYHLRVVVEDMQSGKLFATTKPASIP